MKTISVFIALCFLFAVTNCASIFKADLNPEFDFDDIQELRERRKVNEEVDESEADYPTGEEYEDETGQGDEEEYPEVKPPPIRDPAPVSAPAPAPLPAPVDKTTPEQASEQVPESNLDSDTESTTASVETASPQEQPVLVPAEPAPTHQQSEPAPPLAVPSAIPVETAPIDSSDIPNNQLAGSAQHVESNTTSIGSDPPSATEELPSTGEETEEENEKEESPALKNSVKQPAAEDEDLPEEPAQPPVPQAPVVTASNRNGVLSSQGGQKPTPSRVVPVRGSNQAPNRGSAGNKQPVRSIATGGRTQLPRRGVTRGTSSGIRQNSKPVLRSATNRAGNGIARPIRAGNRQAGKIRPGVQRTVRRPALRNRG